MREHPVGGLSPQARHRASVRKSARAPSATRGGTCMLEWTWSPAGPPLSVLLRAAPRPHASLVHRSLAVRQNRMTAEPVGPAPARLVVTSVIPCRQRSERKSGTRANPPGGTPMSRSTATSRRTCRTRSAGCRSDGRARARRACARMDSCGLREYCGAPSPGTWAIPAVGAVGVRASETRSPSGAYYS